MKKGIFKIIPALIMAAVLFGCSSPGERAEENEKALWESDGWAPVSAVSIVVPAASGGNTDLSARVFAKYALDLTGVEFIVVNANGDSGSVAASRVLSSDPDGYTFLYGHTLVDMAYISGITDYDYTAFTLGPTFAKDPAQGLYVKTDDYSGLDDLIAAAKAAPGLIRACTETGGYTYYELLDFQKTAGIDLTLTDVGSNTEKIVAMLSSQCELMPGSYINTKDYIDAGIFTCIGVPLEERSSLMPGIPTFKEQGIDFVYPDQDFSFYFPPGTDDDIIKYYEDLVQEVLSLPEAQDAIRDIWMEPYYLSAADSALNEENILSAVSRIAGEAE